MDPDVLAVGEVARNVLEGDPQIFPSRPAGIFAFCWYRYDRVTALDVAGCRLRATHRCAPGVLGVSCIYLLSVLGVLIGACAAPLSYCLHAGRFPAFSSRCTATSTAILPSRTPSRISRTCSVVRFSSRSSHLRRMVRLPSAADLSLGSEIASRSGSGTCPKGNRSRTSTSRASAILWSVPALGLRRPVSIWLIPLGPAPDSTPSLAWLHPLSSLLRRISSPTVILPP